MNRSERYAAIRGGTTSPTRVDSGAFTACSFSDEPCRASRDHGLHCVCGGLRRLLCVARESESGVLALEPDERAALVEALIHDN